LRLLFFRSSALMRRPGSTSTHTFPPQRMSRSSPQQAIARRRWIPVCATPSGPPPGSWSMAHVVPAATGPRGWRAETTRTIGGKSGSFCRSPEQLVGESLRRLALETWSRTQSGHIVSHESGYLYKPRGELISLHRRLAADEIADYATGIQPNCILNALGGRYARCDFRNHERGGKTV